MSGTIRKAEEEAIRRARATILKAQRDAAEGAESGLEAMFGQAEGQMENTKEWRDQGDAMIGIEDDDDEDEVESSNEE